MTAGGGVCACVGVGGWKGNLNPHADDGFNPVVQ